MAEEPHAVVSRLTAEFAELSTRMASVAAQLGALDRILAEARGPAPAPQPAWQPPPQPYYQHPYYQHPYYQPAPMPVPMPAPVRPVRPPKPATDRGANWVGKLLAVAGVGVTLIGVVLLLVLAAQAGVLRPELRVGAGAVFAAALVGVAVRWNRRPGGRTGAIALAATGIAAGYLDVIAVTTIYPWIPAAAGLPLAFAIAAGGLTLTRRWDSEALGLLVLVPLAVLAPIVTDGVGLLLIGFLLIASAASLPVQLGKNWTALFAVRTAAVTLPLLVALAAVPATGENPWYLGAAALVAAALAIAGALLVLPGTANRTQLGCWAVVGALPVLVAPIAVDRLLAVLMLAVVSVALLGIVAAADRLPGVRGPVARIWAALSAAAALIAVAVAFDGAVRVAVLLALALTLGIAGRGDALARGVAAVFLGFGALAYLADAPPWYLIEAHSRAAGSAVATLVASVLLVAGVAVAARAVPGRALQIAGGAVLLYAVTTCTVTAGVMIGGTGGGFLAGHVLATICWVALATAMFVAALRIPAGPQRATLITGGLTLTAVAMVKLFLFDLGTLDGIFRVVVFIVAGLILLGTGAGYARSLAQQGDAAGRR